MPRFEPSNLRDFQTLCPIVEFYILLTTLFPSLSMAIVSPLVSDLLWSASSTSHELTDESKLAWHE